MRRTPALAALAASLLSAVAGRAAAQQVQMVIPFPAGGGSDIIGRMMQPALAEELGAPVLIRNAGGAAGPTGATEVAQAKPDGTTVLLTSMSPVVIRPSFRPSVPCRTTSFAPICLVADAPAVLMAPHTSGFRTVANMVAWARARAAPGKLPYASGGIGGLGHTAMVGLTRAAGIELNHIPFRGSGDAVLAMQQGSVQMLTAEANPVHQYGRTRSPCSRRGGGSSTQTRPRCTNRLRLGFRAVDGPLGPRRRAGRNAGAARRSLRAHPAHARRDGRDSARGAPDPPLGAAGIRGLRPRGSGEVPRRHRNCRNAPSGLNETQRDNGRRPHRIRGGGAGRFVAAKALSSGSAAPSARRRLRRRRRR